MCYLCNVNNKQLKYITDMEITEWCSHCEQEVTISDEMTIQHCPNCNALIIPCSVCFWDYINCHDCKLAQICEEKNSQKNH